MSGVGGCETVVTARKRYGYVKLRKCDKLLFRKRFPLNLK